MGSCGDEVLPPGFRFHPTDEELVRYYLTTKVLNNSFTERAIAEVDLNKCEPWDLPERAKMGEKEWYFFSLRDRKYPTGLRTNRATEAGYWKATGKDREVFDARTGELIGMKKTLVFYKGRAPRGEKTNWVMHEYRLEGNLSYHQLCGNSKEEWVVCRIFHKSSRKGASELLNMRNLEMDENYWGSAASLPPLLESPTASNIQSNEDKLNSNPGGIHWQSNWSNNNLGEVPWQSNTHTFIRALLGQTMDAQNQHNIPIQWPENSDNNQTIQSFHCLDSGQIDQTATQMFTEAARHYPVDLSPKILNYGDSVSFI
eukprot:TRINITY_DN3996_c1_g2_i1.p1 TRINITY_DN3996_c1_g2~~TRINITY_DN3996_c1_g2_i1.p1  ORF type:complete len:314 (+),score=55.54 TRINITY_DN3996_c1_g2_i1:656-1597(+)